MQDKGTHPLAALARESVESFVRTGRLIKPTAEVAPYQSEKAGVFVCLKSGGMLRGCIGTFLPTTPSVAEEVIKNAVAAAMEDPRFDTVSPAELSDLHYSVDVLATPEPVKDLKELDPKVYGVIVHSGNRRGLLLPDLEGVDSVDQQIAIAKSKAGIGLTEPVTIYRFEVKRYE